MANDATAPAQPETAEEKRTRVLRESYAKATATLRETHLAEFNGLRQTYAADGGVKWDIPLTEAEKAAAELDRLLTDHPELAAKVVKLSGDPGAKPETLPDDTIPAEVPEPVSPEVDG